MSYNFSLPYVSEYQRDGLVYPVHVWKHGKKLRMDTWHGTNSLVTLPGVQIELSPRLDRMHCMLMKGDDAAQPALSGVLASGVRSCPCELPPPQRSANR